MGFWPFGRDPADVDLVSRVVSAMARDGVRVRGKLTLHFLDPQTEADAEQAGDGLATVTEQVLRELPSHELIGAEPHVVTIVAGRVPAGSPATRAIELASLHVVGEATGARRAADLLGGLARSAALQELHSTSPQEARPPALHDPHPPAPHDTHPRAHPSADPPVAHDAGHAHRGDAHPQADAGAPSGPDAPRPASAPPLRQPSSPPPAARATSFVPPTPSQLPAIPSLQPTIRRHSSRPPATTPPEGSRPPSRLSPSHEGGAHTTPIPSLGIPSGPPLRRPSSGFMRAITADMVMPPGTPPRVMGAALGQIVRDLAARLFIGTLRAHDVLVRKLPLDDESAETLAALVPQLDARPGHYEASRSAEIARWEITLGEGPIEALRREVNVATAFLAYTALERNGVPQSAAVEVLEGICAAAFPQSPSPAVELGRYLHAVEPTIVEELAQHAVRALGTDERPADLGAALAPLLATITDDMVMATAVVRRALH